MLKNYSAVYGQSIFDVCLNTYGSLDNLVKLLRDSGTAGINDVPASGQVYVYDDSLVVDQQVNQAFNLAGIRYATLLGKNGSTYYVTKQKQPRTLPRPNDPAIPDDTGLPGPPSNNEDMPITVESANYTSNANGVASIIPLDKNGNSMAGGSYTIVQVEIEIKPVKAADWHWNTNTGQLSLLNGVVLDDEQTIFYIYQKQL